MKDIHLALYSDQTLCVNSADGPVTASVSRSCSEEPTHQSTREPSFWGSHCFKTTRKFFRNSTVINPGRLGKRRQIVLLPQSGPPLQQTPSAGHMKRLSYRRDILRLLRVCTKLHSSRTLLLFLN